MAYATETREILKSRKSFTCDWCSEEIEVGSPYERYRWYSDGYASTIREHPECYIAMVVSAAKDGEIEFDPGSNPRGCYCGFDADCPMCHGLDVDSKKLFSIEL